MVDLMSVLKIVAAIVICFFLYSIASSPGIEGKAFVMLILGVAFWWFILREGAKQVINPILVHHQRMLRLCELKGKSGLHFLIMSGDAHNQKYVKGEILGGPLILTDQTRVYDATTKSSKLRYPPGHPWHVRYVFMYTPSYGDVYKLPLVGSVLAALRRKCLITVFPSQLRAKDMIGNVEIKGVNTRFVEQMEYISDELFDYDAEMAKLSGEVDRITLADNLAMLPTRIRSAVDSNSYHIKQLDAKDFPVSVGGIQEGGQ